jgi:hypothetical protein
MAQIPAMDAVAIDLTQSTSNSEDEAPAPKRGRYSLAQEDDDVQLVEEAPKHVPRSADTAGLGDEDELVITGAVGAVRDVAQTLSQNSTLNCHRGGHPWPTSQRALAIHNAWRVSSSLPAQVWNTDLPHSRGVCGNAAFSKSPSASNAQHCPKVMLFQSSCLCNSNSVVLSPAHLRLRLWSAQCFCYVCDTPADACTSWGTGSRLFTSLTLTSAAFAA